MPLFYVTGLSGTGKSAVLGELRRRGHRAYGVDEDGYARWINRGTGAADPFPDGDGYDFHAWYREHGWVLDRDGIAALAADARDDPVFLCGVAEGDTQVWDCFAAVVALVADWDTIEARIAGRADDEFGKDPAELAAVRGWHAAYARTYEGRGAVLVDATRPLAEVVDEILEVVSRRCP